ncbi:MAG: hypothetical protein KBB86_00105 [Candidatus Pacebacteria bacterium]|nr:hypothetical protein [Candidatus Paceibacterota bacterium]
MEKEEIINYIQQSQAFWNPCFEKSLRCPVSFPSSELQKLATNWHAVTRHFARSLPRLVSQLTEQQELTNDEKELFRLEKLTQEVLKILGNDWGLGIKKVDDTNDHKIIHFKLFERIPKKLGFVEEIEHETKMLIQSLDQSFSNRTSVEYGFGKLLVVEYTASNILTIGKAFEKSLYQPGHDILKGEDLIYFKLHEKLEKTHADDSQSLITLVGNTPERLDQIFKSVKKSTKVFGNFWQKMAEITFN